MIEATYIDHMGSDLSVVNAARVSFGKQSEWEVDYDNDMFTGENVLSERDAKLIRYLAKHKHLSPFGHAFASFHVKAPVFVARQLVKHKFLRWNEISRRYVDEEPEFYNPKEWRGRSEDKKQGSSDEIIKEICVDLEYDDEDADLYPPDKQYLRPFYPKYMPMDVYVDLKINKGSVRLYNTLLDEGVAPEQARMVLPQSTMTEWYWSGSLDAFAAMCKLRCAPDTQYESRIVADQISEKMGELFPVSWDALMKGESDE